MKHRYWLLALTVTVPNVAFADPLPPEPPEGDTLFLWEAPTDRPGGVVIAPENDLFTWRDGREQYADAREPPPRASSPSSSPEVRSR